MKPKTNIPFVQIPLPLFERDDLTWTAKATWAYLHNGARRKRANAVAIGCRLLAEKLNVSKPTILKALEDLVAARCLERVECGTARSHYRTLEPWSVAALDTPRFPARVDLADLGAPSLASAPHDDSDGDDDDIDLEAIRNGGAW